MIGKGWRRAVLVGVLCCASAASAREPAAGDEGELDARARLVEHWRIEADGSFVVEREAHVKVLTEKALSGARRDSISYSTSVERAEVITAYTEKADGRRLEAPRSNFQIETNTGRSGAEAAFSDRTTLTAVFPEVAIGDTVVFAYRLTATRPMFPNHFSMIEEYSKRHAYDEVRLSIDAPETLWTQYAAREFQEARNERRDGRRILEWAWSNPVPEKSKRRNYSVSEYGELPGVAFSTFHDYAEIAAAYGARALPKAVPTPAVRKLADDVAKDATTPRETARLLYEWVARNIEYAGNCIGIGAVVPRDVEFTLTNHMGDCKDHATLLQALLAAKGIASTQALVNSGRAYRLAKIPVVSTINHVINYLPELDLYLDATSDDTPFGWLPAGDADKPVLLVEHYREGARTPRTPADGNEQRISTVVEIRADGSVTGHAEVTLKGMFGIASRSTMRETRKSDEADYVKNYFQSSGFIASGTFEKEDAKALRDTHAYQTRFEVKDLVIVPGPGAFRIQPLIFSQQPIDDYVGPATEPVEEADVTCWGGSSIEDYVYDFPPELKLLAAPRDLRIDAAIASYAATYRIEGRRLTVHRELHDRTPGNTCTPAQMQAFKEFAQKVTPNLRAQVVYQ